MPHDKGAPHGEAGVALLPWFQSRLNADSREPKKATLAALVVMAAMVVGCGNGSKKHLPRGFQFSQQQPDGIELRSRQVLLVADNQIHYLYGDPVAMRSAFTDRFVGSAIRPVQLDLFGQDLLSWVLDKWNNLPVIHLGDALDLACVAEWKKFVENMAPLAATRNAHGPRKPTPWVMIPGNHDGYFFGNVHGGQWDEACQGGGGPLTKDQLIRRYVAELREQKTVDPGMAALDEELGTGPLPDEFSWRYSGTAPAFLIAIAWSLEARDQQPWRSFVAQEIDLTRTRARQGESASAILVDTTQYPARPTLVGLVDGPPAGAGGNLLSDQAAIIEDWLKASKSPYRAVMGHHPGHELGTGAKTLVESALEGGHVLLYVSAHTHHGRYYVRKHVAGHWLELNVGSILDWPPEVRTFSFADAANKPGIQSGLYRLSEHWEGPNIDEDAPDCDPIWEPKPGDADYFFRYSLLWTPSPDKTELDLMNTLLASYERLLSVAPTKESKTWPGSASSDAEVLVAIGEAMAGPLADKKQLLGDLEYFERDRVPLSNSLRRDYRLCQALWASQYDETGGRAPSAHDDHIWFPQRKRKDE